MQDKYNAIEFPLEPATGCVPSPQYQFHDPTINFCPTNYTANRGH